MLVSTKGRYALRVMIDLAKHQNDSYIPLRDIANRQEISEKYLEAILKILVKEKMVVGLRGKKGGYMLNCNPSVCTAWDVISATENGLSAVACLEDGASKCPRSHSCETLPMWVKFDHTVQEFFMNYTISDLAKNQLWVYD